MNLDCSIKKSNDCQNIFLNHEDEIVKLNR